MRPRLLIVEDDPLFAKVMKTSLELAGYKVEHTSNGAQALELLARSEFDIVCTDKNLPGIDGVQLIREIKRDYPDMAVVMMTGFATIESAVDAIKLGAEDYIVKPFETPHLIAILEKALTTQRLKSTKQFEQKRHETLYNFEKIITSNSKMLEVFALAKQVLDLNTTTLIQGETGTGKELLASAIHYNSKRKNMPFIPVNCPAIPEHLFESELFGYKKGAFTGANQDKKGFFQLAQGGTLLLDEIGDMPLQLQVKLLRVLEDKKLMVIGGHTPIELDVKVIATTNRNLEEDVGKGTFRRDLFFRINTVTLQIPPLRERKEDIPLIVDHYLAEFAKSANKSVKRLSKSAIDTLLRYDFPGNVRELRNIIERAVITAKGEEIEQLPGINGQKKNGYVSFSQEFKNARENFEKSYLDDLLKRHKGNLTKSSEESKIPYRNLFDKLKKYGFKREDYLD